MNSKHLAMALGLSSIGGLQADLVHPSGWPIKRQPKFQPRADHNPRIAALRKSRRQMQKASRKRNRK